ncbi:hypothetical protein [Novosphingobium mangrovi (ex Hu et al. 2023)]|uniref:Uncharacterized protein n=1 Tax=Novosphingobium mangrovi (ex Hu et al. 2023) TaxID=2930094 RepID=A0ABT0AEU1_9SPHN|nr:hypothetical protein [Novosphingobium mangrovi (ex Hu et al. 2023)]MCJ1961712.1 hypothetical protein [Novosphingobium mangrovi (ex Hu et al. 2023)]
MSIGRKGSARRRYFVRLSSAAGVYLVSLFAATRLLEDNAPPSGLSIAVALVPGLAVVGMIWAIGRFYAELEDEYLRLLEVRKAMFATGLTLAGASVWGLLEMLTSVPALPVFWVFPIWCFGLGVGTLVNRITLGDGGCA